MKVPDDRLRKSWVSRMSFHDVNHPIAITDAPLEPEQASANARDIAIDNFSHAGGHVRRRGLDDHVDESRRRSAQYREHGSSVQVARARY
jgi:hypothetical protein